MDHYASSRESIQARALAGLLVAALAGSAAAGAAPPEARPDPGDEFRLAAASVGRPAFALGLEAALHAEGPRFGDRSDTAAATSAPLASGAVITLGDLRAIAASMRQETPAAAPTESRKDGSFGRWLKRHWWVPALVGAAVLVTAGESLYDDDDRDDED
jgi:hypothetical protein